MSMLSGVQEGQVLFALGEPGRSSGSRVSERIVARVGRRWITTTTGGRFDIATGFEDAGQYTPCVRAFTSKEAVDRYLARVSVQATARRLMQFPKLDLLSDEQLDQLITLLQPTQRAEGE